MSVTDGRRADQRTRIVAVDVASKPPTKMVVGRVIKIDSAPAELKAITDKAGVGALTSVDRGGDIYELAVKSIGVKDRYFNFNALGALVEERNFIRIRS